MRKWWKLLAVWLVLGVLAAFGNPSADQHRTRIQEAIAERSTVDKLLGIGRFTALVSRYHSLGLASYTVVDDRIVSVGAFGVVWVRG